MIEKGENGGGGESEGMVRINGQAGGREGVDYDDVISHPHTHSYCTLPYFLLVRVA